MVSLTNRFHVAVRLFSNRSQMTSKCGKNISDTLGCASCATFLFLPHFDVICDLLLNRRTATWNLFVKETMVQANSSSWLKELRDDLAIHGDCGELSTSTLSRYITNKLPSGRNYSRKRLRKCASERFTPENIVYTQLYIDYLKDKDPSSVKFFDESGFQLPDAGHRNFGFSPVGEDCVEVRRYLSTANLTLNFLVGFDGVKYGNIVEGASNSVQFLRFFDEA